MKIVSEPLINMPCALDFPWDEMAHIFVNALTLDLSMLGCTENQLVV